MKTSILQYLSCLFVAASAYAAPGDLDPTFGNWGRKIIGLEGVTVAAQAVAVQNGKILIAGFTESITGGNFVIARLDASGTPDTTFADQGISVISVSPGSDGAISMATQTDGKIIAAGWVSVEGDRKIAVIRVDDSGMLDPTFGTGGITTTSLGNDEDVANSVAVQGDGKILVGGWSRQPGSRDFAVVRYHTNGTLDTSFGTGGAVLTNFNGTSQDTGECLAINSDSTIVLGGTHDDNVTGSRLAMVKYTTNGTLDPSFGDGGKVTTYIPRVPGFSNGSIETLVLQANGNIVVGGTSSNGTKISFLIARYLPSGSLDSGFGNEGVTLHDPTSGHDYGECIKLQTDGKIMFGGYSLLGSGSRDFVLARYLSNGSPDPAFGTSGRSVVDFGADDEAVSMCLQDDGKAVLAGFSSNHMTLNFALARLGGDGALLSHLQAWRLRWFGTTDGIGNSADSFDADHDRRENILEFATDRSPLLADPCSSSISLNGSNLEFCYARSRGALADGFTFVVEWSDTLQGPNWSNAGVTETVINTDLSVQNVRSVFPIGTNNRRFARLRIVSP